jgi:hypothetical protein
MIDGLLLVLKRVSELDGAAVINAAIACWVVGSIIITGTITTTLALSLLGVL